MNHQIIPPAVNLSSFPDQKDIQTIQLGSQNHPLRLLSVGRLEWKKGYEHALHAVRFLLDRNLMCEYQIIGAGDYEAALFYARFQLGLEGVVHFSGAKSHTGVIDELYKADVLLHPSLSEGFCNAVLEAQAVGLPVVCTDAGGLPENVQDGETGFVVPRRDPNALADKLAQLAADGELRKKMGEAGRRHVVANFGMEQQLDAFEVFYEHL
jgi:colanic acid/amylovoran biosynthesis glycosyltransferase